MIASATPHMDFLRDRCVSFGITRGGGLMIHGTVEAQTYARKHADEIVTEILACKIARDALTVARRAT